jgi:hypothetical protein
LKNFNQVLIVYLQPLLLCFVSVLTRRPLAASPSHQLPPRRPFRTTWLSARPPAACATSAGLFLPLHVAPPSPAAATHAVSRQQLLPLAVPSPGLEARSRTLLDFFYPLTHPLLPSSFLSSTAFAGPPPQPLSAVVSRLHRPAR